MMLNHKTRNKSC